jgi:hypothetical protein
MIFDIDFIAVTFGTGNGDMRDLFIAFNHDRMDEILYLPMLRD